MPAEPKISIIIPVSVAESLDKFVQENKSSKQHFLYKHLHTMVFCAQELAMKIRILDQITLISYYNYRLRQWLRKLLRKY